MTRDGSLVTKAASHEESHEVLGRLISGTLRTLVVDIVGQHMGGEMALLGPRAGMGTL